MKVSKLKYNPDNPRKISPAHLDKLKKSIKDFPQMMELRPIVYDPQTMCVLGGNQRLAAIKALDMTEIPDTWVLSADKLSDRQKKEFILKDNIPLGEWDFAILETAFDEFDLGDMGIELPQIEEVETPTAEDDDYEQPVEIEAVQTKIKFGDIITIGKHRLMCGDSTSEADVALLMDGQKAELLFTSPPYSDMRTYTGESSLDISHIVTFIAAFSCFTEYQVINLGIQRKNHEINQYWDEYISAAKKAGYKFLSWNVWAKQNAGSIGNQSAFFPISHEWMFVFGKKFKDINRTVERKTEITNKRKRYVRHADGSMKPSSIGKQEELKEMESVFFANSELGRIRSEHPATFPVDLPAEHIKAMTNQKDNVCDPFLGSGTTMVACHQLDRKCYGMEISPQYCQVVVDRMKKLDPEISVAINGQPYE